MSWESTLTYYQIINEAVKRELGGLHSAKLLLASVDFAQIEACQQRGDWAQSARILTDAAQSLEAAGAEFLLICTNTMHKVVPQIQAAIHIRFSTCRCCRPGAAGAGNHHRRAAGHQIHNDPGFL